MAGLLAAAPIHAQRPGPFVPLGSHLDRLVSWLIDEGALPHIDPFTRPFRLAAVRLGIAEQDTTTLSPAGQRAWRVLRNLLFAAADTTSLVADAGVDAYSNARRDQFRSGKSGVAPFGGLRASLVRGPIVAVVNPAFENRLIDDPQYYGKKDRVIAGRMVEAYVAYMGERGDLLFGRTDRNWGPALFDGLLLSPSVYARDMLAGTLRIAPLALTSVAERLDDFPNPADSTEAPVNRYFFAHRLTVRASRGVWVAFTEAGVYGGPGRGIEPAFHAPLNLALLSEYNDLLEVNVLLGADLQARLGRGLTLSAGGMLDDIQVDRGTTRDRRPTSYGATVVVTAALPSQPVHVSMGYTRVSSLAYRNSFESFALYAYRSIGLGRNFSDYDQALLRVEASPGGCWRAGAEVSYLRQGSYDFRQAFPSDSVLAQPGQGFLVTPVRAALAARAMFTAQPTRGVDVDAQVGVDGRLTGASRLIWGLRVRLAYDVMRGTWSASAP